MNQLKSQVRIIGFNLMSKASSSLKLNLIHYSIFNQSVQAYVNILLDKSKFD